jgi:Ca2+-binding EF-hand superfamily protein
MVEATMNRYDRNRNGVLEREEWSAFRTDPSAADKNNDGRITRDELAEWMAGQYGGGRRDRGGTSDEAGAGVLVNDRWGDRRSFRTPTPTDRLPDGLPEWFARADRDGDGQVTMSEYAASWSDRVAADFAQFDLNGDGVITAAECLKAVEAGAVQGLAQASASREPVTSDRQRGSSFARRSAEPAANPPDRADGAPPAEPAVSDGSIPPKFIKHAVGLIKKYDTNQDGVLTEDEWSSMTNDYSAADTDQDGRITPTELAAALMGGGS